MQHFGTSIWTDSGYGELFKSWIWPPGFDRFSCMTSEWEFSFLRGKSPMNAIRTSYRYDSLLSESRNNVYKRSNPLRRSHTYRPTHHNHRHRTEWQVHFIIRSSYWDSNIGSRRLHKSLIVTILTVKITRGLKNRGGILSAVSLLLLWHAWSQCEEDLSMVDSSQYSLGSHITSHVCGT